MMKKMDEISRPLNPVWISRGGGATFNDRGWFDKRLVRFDRRGVQRAFATLRTGFRELSFVQIRGRLHGSIIPLPPSCRPQTSTKVDYTHQRSISIACMYFFFIVSYCRLCSAHVHNRLNQNGWTFFVRQTLHSLDKKYICIFVYYICVYQYLLFLYLLS